MKALDRKEETTIFTAKRFRKGLHEIIFEESIDGFEHRWFTLITLIDQQRGIPVFNCEVLLENANNVEEAFAMVDEAIKFGQQEFQSQLTRHMLLQK